MPFLPRLVMSFAGSDPTGGAGLQADLLTLASLGCHPLTVVTAITVQHTSGVDALLPLGADWVDRQARALLEEMTVSAFKLGALGSPENAAAVAQLLGEYPDVPVVVDPVLASARGDPLSSADLVDAMRDLIIPLATILTPNSLEARLLASRGHDADGLPLEECARRLIELGCAHVLVTGTHETTADVINTLYGAGGAVRSDHWDRLPGSFHGSGCTLASAIAARLAHGAVIEQAVYEAQAFTWQALAAGFRPGAGQHLPDRFFRTRDAANPR